LRSAALQRLSKDTDVQNTSTSIPPPSQSAAAAIQFSA
jgi:hypothetical protein